MTVQTFHINTLVKLNSGMFMYLAENLTIDADTPPSPTATVNVIHIPIITIEDGVKLTRYKIFVASIEEFNSDEDEIFLPFNKEEGWSEVVVARQGVLHTGNILPDSYTHIRGKECVEVLLIFGDVLNTFLYPLNAIYFVEPNMEDLPGEEPDVMKREEMKALLEKDFDDLPDDCKKH